MAKTNLFADAGMLLARVIHAVQKGERITFLFGSALTAPGGQPNEVGVPDANSMIDEVVSTFRGTDEFEALQRAINQADQSSRYQETMKFVIDCRGQDALNELIQGAVLKARSTPRKPNQKLEEIELDSNGWYLRPAVEAVGRLVVENPRAFTAQILTSNFDPLLEVSLRKAGGNAAAIFMSADGQFRNVFAPETTQVVHFHGYWHGSDTLHTPAQLTRNRPQLKSSLRSLLRETTVIVVGYGGWSDVFTRTLVEVIGEQNEQLNILWAFYSDNDDDIANRNPVLLNQFEALAGQRVVYYKGVDCHVFLPTLREKLLKIRPTAERVVIPVESVGEAFAESVIDLSASGDHPPQSATWVGREEELRVMLSSQSKVIAITGLGGSGKSTLAAKYLTLREGAQEIMVSYWADCREQGNTLHTQLVRMVERVSKGAVRGSQLQESNTEDIIETLLETLGEKRAILVFDNIDQYVDVELCQAVGTMHALLEKALTRSHSAQFIFTTRPRLDYLHPEFLQIQLAGLTMEETRKLFEVSGVTLDLATRSEIITELHNLTRGHALALNLIATQVARNKADIATLISKLKANVEAGIEHPIFPEIWASLNPRQQTVLRYLAEQIHPDPEQRVASYLGNVLNYNQFSKAIKTLKALNLVVVKAPGPDQENTLELHPLIRDYIRRRFPKEERVLYIDSILHFYDRMIGKFRGAILSAPYSVLENWTAKVELSLQRDRHDEALEALSEVQHPLQKGGYSEEFVRLAVGVLELFPLTATNDQSLAKYDGVFSELVSSLAELGRYDEADTWLARFEKLLVGKTARYILYCGMRAYRYWFAGDWKAAIDWAKRGVDLKTAGNLDTKHDCSHILALAQRDSGEVEPALKYFLEGEALDKVISQNHVDSERGGAYYGNIGRCLQLQGHCDGSLICIKKSAKILEKANDSNVLLNRGYAAFWMGEILAEQKQLEAAYVAFRRAAIKWKVPSPPRARQAIEQAERLRGELPLNSTLPSDDWECDRAFIEWLNKS